MDPTAIMTWRILFYCTVRGREPVNVYLNSLPTTDQVVLARWLERLERDGHDLPPNRVKFVEDKIWELRVRSTQGHHRILYCVHQNCAILLVAFLKKTDETPQREKELAKRRRRDWMERSNEWRHLCQAS